jgi:histidine triad (HIT) family protein
MPTIFNRIIAGEIPCHKIAEDAEHLAFLDIRPLKAGHTLVIPKKETDYIFDMEDAALGRLMQFAKKVAGAIKRAVPCKKIGIMVAGLEVPHTHIHLIPIDQVSELNFAHAKAASESELLSTASKIRKEF